MICVGRDHVTADVDIRLMHSLNFFRRRKISVSSPSWMILGSKSTAFFSSYEKLPSRRIISFFLFFSSIHSFKHPFKLP
ncbi:hypothetical protein PMAYCL1PPCAC_32508, partial [Pristionchus mayeri]